MKDFNKIKDIKLILIDCDGVLYHPSELDVNAIIYAFDNVCDKSNMKSYKFSNIDYHNLKDKPVKTFFNYMNYTAKKHGIKTEDFILNVIKHIDYSRIKPDKDNILQKLIKLSQKYKICICSNNHKAHINNILKAKFNINAEQFPFDIFDINFAFQNDIFYDKHSDVFIKKLEQHFDLKARDFLWIDDTQPILETLTNFGCQTILVTQENHLSDIINKITKYVST